MPLIKKKSKAQSDEATPKPSSLAIARQVQAASRKGSGQAGPDASTDADRASASVAQSIMKKRSKQLDFTKGGEGLETDMYGTGKNDPEMEEKYFDGGEINEPDESEDYDSRNRDAGEAEEGEDFDDMNKDIGESIASAIMRKRSRR